MRKWLCVYLALVLALCFIFIPSSLSESKRWYCIKCGKAGNTGNYCSKCGYPSPDLSETPYNAPRYEGHAYYIYFDKCSWEEAKTKCEAKGGHLLTVTSSEEQAIIEEMMKKDTGMEFWMGITDSAKEGNWQKWITGEPVSYTNWGTGEPDDFNGNQDYGVIVSSVFEGSTYHIAFGQWDDVGYNDKSDRRAYICEWEPSD